MSAPTPRRLATAGTLALALALAVPAAALAEPVDQEQQGSSAEHRKDEGRPSPAATPTPKAGSGGSASSSSSSTGKSASSSKGSNGTSSSAGKNDGKAKGKEQGKGKSGEGRANGGDPRGNNGTVKVDGLAFDDTSGTEAHVGCTFQVDFFGFDAGDTADITLTGRAPTGGGLLWSASDRLISTDAAGGGKDVDESITLSVSPHLSELLSIPPHPQSGWHVTLAVDVDGAPGGAKQKTFWIDCPPTSALAGTTEQAATGAATLGAKRLTAAQTPTFGTGTTTVVSQSLGGSTVVAADRLATRAVGAGRTDKVSARGMTAPRALPFTGIEGLTYLVALGLAAVGVGTAAHRLGRRRAGAGTLG